jgi:hypothetical protein
MPTLDDLIGYDPPTDLAGVTQDAYAKVYLPGSASEWSLLLTGSGINAPSSIWLASDAVGASLADRGAAGRTVTIAGSPTLGATAPGFAATGIQCTDNSAAQSGSFTSPDVATTSQMLLQVYAFGTVATGNRYLNMIGSASAEMAQITAGNRVQAQSGANTADGVATYSNILVVITKFDRANSVLGVYTRGEQVKATWFAPLSSTTSYLFGAGAATDATLVYGAYWTGSDAEITDAKIQQLIDYIYGDSTTLSRMQAGSLVSKLVVAIEGCQYLLSDAPQAAVLQAWAGTDWTSVLGGLFVELKNSHTVQPWEPFTGAGSCQIQVIDTDNSDTFGILVNKRAAGAETELTATIDRNDTTIPVASTQDFTSSGTAYIGTEAVGYTGKTATSLTGCTRGKYSPFGCAPSGSGGNRFANHHRKGQDSYHVQMRPIVSQLPRVWMGKRVGVWLHTWDPVAGTLNSRDEAQLLYAGRIAGIADDPNSFATTIDVEPVHEEIRNGVIGKDLFSAELAQGMFLVEGRTFTFRDFKDGSVAKDANSLTVVASGAVGTNQINEGIYSLSLLCEKLSSWLAAEKLVGRIYGTYTWCSPVSSNVGPRTKCYSSITDASTLNCYFTCGMPAEVCAFLGLTNTEPANVGVTETVFLRFQSNRTAIMQGTKAPFTTLVFKPSGPGRLAQEFSEVPKYYLLNERGIFIDQYDWMPASIKSSSMSDSEWGLFLLGESILMVASYEDGVLTKCWLAPFKLTADKDTDAIGYFGNRADEPEAGPMVVRQVLILEASLYTLLLNLIYGTGTPGYNHSDHDSMGFGLGLGIPGEMLGGSLERSLASLPKATYPISILIDEPKKFIDIFSGDLLVRRAFLRWKDESFEFAQWKTPLLSNSIATLTESNKAAPSGHQENHRIASLESSDHVRAIVKLDYCRDLAVGRDGQYLKSVQIEDQTAVDDAGGSVKPFTIKLPNTFNATQNTGAAIEALLPEFIAFMPVLARPLRLITRSVDLRFFEALSVGDIVTVTDAFARDPLTGRRGIASRPAFVSKISYDLGGASPDGSVRPMGGEVELMFLDVHRGEAYTPSAQVDDTATNGGYVAGTKVLTCFDHKYSHTLTVYSLWGRISRAFYIEEDADATRFVATDKIRITEMDPADPAAPLTWDDTVASQSGNTITLTTGLAGWDSTKKYRLTYQPYSSCTTAQQDYSFQADSTDMMVQDLEVPYHHVGDSDDHGFVENTGTEAAELIPTNSYGDGIANDTGVTRALITSVNQFIDRKSAHQCPMLWHYEDGSGSFSFYVTLWTGLVYLGQDIVGSTVGRAAAIAPFYKSGGGDAYLRVTLSNTPPLAANGSDGSGLDTARFTDAFASAEWITSNTTYETGTTQLLDLNTKSIEAGYVWVTIEGHDNVYTKGLAKFIEGPRTVD